MERIEIAIIGTGPAGISAAITATARNKKVVLFGKKDLSNKVESAHQVNNYPGLPEISGSDFAAAFANHLDKMGIEITEKQITAVYAMGDYFALQSGNETFEAESVILATGVSQSKELDGESAFLGRGVSYCATCDAQFYRDKRVAVLAYNKESAEEAEFLAEIASHVDFFPQPGATIPEENEKITIIKEKPTGIKGGMKADVVVTDQGEYAVDGVFILRDAVAPNQLVPGIAVSDSHVTVDLQMKTNIAGCFACGDIAGKPYQYVKSAGQGNVAALSAVTYLAEKKKARESKAE